MQVSGAEAALQQAESDVRAEVVSEITAVITELRTGYEAHVVEMDGALKVSEARGEELEQLLAQVQAQNKVGRHHGGTVPANMVVWYR